VAKVVEVAIMEAVETPGLQPSAKPPTTVELHPHKVSK